MVFRVRATGVRRPVVRRGEFVRYGSDVVGVLYVRETFGRERGACAYGDGR